MSEHFRNIELQLFLRERLEAINPLLHPLHLKDWIPDYADFEPWKKTTPLLLVNQSSRHKLDSLLNCCDAFMFPFSGLTAGGKDTIRDLLIESCPQLLTRPVSATTRPIRANEPSTAYEYLSTDQFQNLIDTDQLVEFVFQYNHYYGMPKQNLLHAVHLAQSGAGGPIVLSQTEVSSWRKLREFLNNYEAELPTLSIFTLPQLSFKNYTRDWLPTHRPYDYEFRADRSIYELITASQEADLLLLNPLDSDVPGYQAFQTLHRFFGELLPKHRDTAHFLER